MRKKNLKDNFADELRAACEGMTFISEIDAEVIPIKGRKISEATTRDYLVALSVDSEEKIQTIPLDHFFERLIVKEAWHGRRESKQKKKWLRLKNLLEENLERIQVVRIGAVRIDIYIVGTNESGEVSGVKTRAVET